MQSERPTLTQVPVGKGSRGRPGPKFDLFSSLPDSLLLFNTTCAHSHLYLCVIMHQLGKFVTCHILYKEAGTRTKRPLRPISALPPAANGLLLLHSLDTATSGWQNGTHELSQIKAGCVVNASTYRSPEAN